VDRLARGFKGAGAAAHGCDRGGRVVLPLGKAAAVSTGLRVRRQVKLMRACVNLAQKVIGGYRVRIRIRVRARVIGLGVRVGLGRGLG